MRNDGMANAMDVGSRSLLTSRVMRTPILAGLALVTLLAPVVRAAPVTLVVSQPPTDCGDPENKFGHALAAVGPHLLVGAPGEVCGFAHLIDGRTGTGLLTLRSPIDLEANAFGTAVAAAGRNLVVSAPGESAVWVFDRRTGALHNSFGDPACCTPGFEASAFGASVAAIDHRRVAVGAPGGDGVVHVFDVPSGGLLRTIQNPTPGVGRHFGRSLAVAGRHLLVGAPIDGPSSSVGGAFVIDPETGGVVLSLAAPVPTPGDRFGAAVAAQRGRFLVGAPGALTAYLFGHTGAVVRSFDDPAGQAGSAFGAAVALRGGSALVGARFFDPGDGQGAAFLFRWRTGALVDQLAGLEFGDDAGASVALLPGGFAVGAPTQGAGYVVIER